MAYYPPIDINSQTEGYYIHKKYPQIKFHKSSFMKEWLEESVTNVKTIIDVGALDGGDSFRFSLWYPNAKIYTIEASPHNFNTIKDKLYGENNIEIFNVAISDKIGKIDLYQTKYVDGTEYKTDFSIMAGLYDYVDSHKNNHSLKTHDVISVDTTTIDEFCKTNNITEIDFLHVDVEGAGLELVKGMNNVLPKVIFIEKENQNLFKGKSTSDSDLIDELAKKGYKVSKNLVNDFVFVKE